MKLVHPEMDYALLGNENVCMEWIIENPQTFSSYVQEIRQQCNGEEGKFVLSHGDKELNFAKSVELIFDLLSVDCNDKRILTKLYTQLEQLAYGEQFFVQTQELTRTGYITTLTHIHEVILWLHLQQLQSREPEAIGLWCRLMGSLATYQFWEFGDMRRSRTTTATQHIH